VLLMAAGVFLWRPDLAMVTVALVALLILQSRAGRLSASLASRGEATSKAARFPAGAVDAADARFLRAANFTVVAQFVGYFVFLVGLDVGVRQSGGAAPAGFPFLVLTAVGLATALAGREVARQGAWRGFATQFPEVWAGPGGLDGGRALRTAGDYLEWRSGVEPRD